MNKIPRVNKHECTGCSLCVYALPEVFRITPDGISEVYDAKGAPAEKIQKVIDECPMGCVLWYEINSQ